MSSQGGSFVERVCETAARQPHTAAIEVDGSPALTYRDLMDRASRIAAAVDAQAVAAEAVVGLALPKSAEWVVAMLGTWWAGRAWMPIDTALPVDRRRSLLRRADCRLIVGAADQQCDGGVVALAPNSAGDNDTRADPAALHPNDLAYVIFTSGSTGVPKGVEVSHAGLVSMLDQQIAAFGLGPGSRCLWMLSTAFDASVSDVGTALLSGATLCIESVCRLRSPDDLLTTLERRAITYVDMPPSVLATLDPARAPASLETIVIGGEACAAAAVRGWATATRLINVYGPTEATVCTSIGLCGPDWSRPLLGRPLRGVDYRVADAEGAELPDGVPGELWIRGAQLARGYRNEPNLTADRFVQVDGDRWYRTGDRVVRRGSDYEFAGRLDRQCKLRGMLVAPEEIEAALRAHPAVRDAAVVRRTLGRREALVAFIDGAKAIGERNLAAHVAQLLPAWMVPARFEWIDELPRTATGKVDFAALAERGLAARVPRGGPARGPAQQRVAGWFATVLGTEPIGRADDFFALGGDSLAVVELIAAAAHDNIALGPELITTASTVKALAAALDKLDVGEEMDADALRAEARQLALEIPAPTPRLAPPALRHVLVTGATGFLGRRVVTELLQQTSARISCLVRGRDPVDRLGRACPAAAAASKDHDDDDADDDDGRVSVLTGDVAASRFGLGDADWHGLADTVDAVLHLAAVVNLALPYRELRAANLLGVKTALELAAAGRPKPLHYASTLSVFVSTDRNRGVAREDDDLSDTRWVYGGYAQSKWAAEALVAASRWPTAIYRLGLLTGARGDGHMPDNHWLTMFVRGLASIGCVPGDLDHRLAFDVTPVDDAARALVRLAGSAAPAVYHLAGPEPVRVVDLVRVMRACGVRLEVVGNAAWRARLKQAGAAATAVRLGLSGQPLHPSRRHNHRAMDLCQATGIRFDRRRALAAGAATGPADDDLLARYVTRALDSWPSQENLS